MEDDNGWQQHKRDVLRRLDSIEGHLKSQDATLTKISTAMVVMKTDKKWAGFIIMGAAGLIAFLTSIGFHVFGGGG